jgi:hypothetical protein
MGLILTVEAWILSIFGWAWLAVQDIWMPSLLCSQVYYGFLLLASCNLLLSALAVDSSHVKVAYFNTVLGVSLFYISCIADSFDTLTLGGEQFTPPTPPTGCCANCNIAHSNRVLFFMESPLYMVQAGLTLGYILIQLLLAGGQMFDANTRSVWSGAACGPTLGLLLTIRFIIMFDDSTLVLVPASVVYLLLFSQPLIGLSVVFWLFFYAFFVLLIFEGIPQLTLFGFRVVRSVAVGLSAAFVVISGIVFGLRGMLTLPLFLVLLVFLGISVVGVLEAYLGELPYKPPTLVSITGEPPPALPAQRPRTLIPIPILLGAKKGV